MGRRCCPIRTLMCAIIWLNSSPAISSRHHVLANEMPFLIPADLLFENLGAQCHWLCPPFNRLTACVNWMRGAFQTGATAQHLFSVTLLLLNPETSRQSDAKLSVWLTPKINSLICCKWSIASTKRVVSNNLVPYAQSTMTVISGEL